MIMKKIDLIPRKTIAAQMTPKELTEIAFLQLISQIFKDWIELEPRATKMEYAICREYNEAILGTTGGYEDFNENLYGFLEDVIEPAKSFLFSQAKPGLKLTTDAEFDETDDPAYPVILSVRIIELKDDD